MRADPPSPTASAQLGLWSLGLCLSLPPHSQPVRRLWPPIERAPGNARPWWAGPDLPLTVLEGPGVPSGYGHCNSNGGGGHLAQCDLCPSRADQSTSGPSVPLPQPPLSVISLPSKQLVLPGKLPNESTMQGLWKESSKGRGLVPSTRPTGRNTCRTAGLYPTEAKKKKKKKESGQPGHSFISCCHLPAVWCLCK